MASKGPGREMGGGVKHAALTTRHELRAWANEEVASWSSAMAVTLNLRSHATTDAGAITRLDEGTAKRAIVLFGNMLDRAIHGRLVQRFGRRVPRIPFLEYGADRGWHCHVLIEPPYMMSPENFADLIRKIWASSLWATTCHIREADDGAAGYLTKARSKHALEVWSDTLIVEAVVLRTK